MSGQDELEADLPCVQPDCMDEQQLRQQVVGRRIATRRQQLGLTQRKMAEQLQVSQAAVDGWEHGRSIPRWPQLRELAVLLRVDASWLVRPLVDDWTGHLGQDGEDLDPGSGQPDP
jgi:transcriptional regulator with XRE-family HTH domain